jgi:hypothetical protein
MPPITITIAPAPDSPGYTVRAGRICYHAVDKADAHDIAAEFAAALIGNTDRAVQIQSVGAVVH